MKIVLQNLVIATKYVAGNISEMLHNDLAIHLRASECLFILN